MTGQELFEKALDLCGLHKNEYDLPADTQDLKSRAVNLINILLSENASLDCRIKRTEHTVKSINSLEESLDFTEIVENAVLPYGLARLFLMGEDDVLANQMALFYENGKKTALSFGKAKHEEITEVYK